LDYDDFVVEASSDVAQALAKLRRADREERAEAVRLAVRRAATRWSGKRPQVQVLLIGP
jgi:ribonuclease J